MRENLFRGKHIHVLSPNQHIEGEWACGYLCDKNYIRPTELHAEILVDLETVCQYAGYKDLKEIRVFEHDIVLCDNNKHIGHVVFKKGQFLIEWKGNPSLRKDIHYWFTERRMFVVGNMFDNKEIYEGF